MVSFLDLDTLFFDVIGTVNEVFLFDFLDFSHESLSTLDDFPFLDLFLSEVTHHFSKFDTLFPLLSYLLVDFRD